MCKEKKDKPAGKAKITRKRLQMYLYNRYKDQNVVRKFTDTFNFNAGMTALTLEDYTKFMEKILNESPPKTLIRMAFRIYDFNNDRKIDVLDLYALMHQFQQIMKPAEAEEVKAFEETMLTKIFEFNGGV